MSRIRKKNAKEIIFFPKNEKCRRDFDLEDINESMDSYFIH